MIAGVIALVDRKPVTGINEQLVSSWSEAGFDTRVAPFREFTLTATNGEAVIVPEPESLRLFWLAALMFLWQSSRRNAAFTRPFEVQRDDDTQLTSDDLSLSLDDGGYEAGPRPTAVPEPGSPATMLLGLAWLIRAGRQRS